MWSPRRRLEQPGSGQCLAQSRHNSDCAASGDAMDELVLVTASIIRFTGQVSLALMAGQPQAPTRVAQSRQDQAYTIAKP